MITFILIANTDNSRFLETLTEALGKTQGYMVVGLNDPNCNVRTVVEATKSGGQPFDLLVFYGTSAPLAERFKDYRTLVMTEPFTEVELIEKVRKILGS